jgi:hypothetical protein
MTNAERIARQIERVLPTLRPGTLRFWGEWFGRPNDNIHTVVECAGIGDLLQMTFDQGEVLSVFDPDDVQISETAFRIGSASRVRWEWFYYGRPKTPSNLYYRDYARAEGAVSATTNVDWSAQDLRPDAAKPAVEMA